MTAVQTASPSKFQKVVQVFMLVAMALMLVSPMAMPTDVYANDNGEIPEITVDGGKVSFGSSALDGGSENAWNTLLTKYRGIIVGVAGFGLATMVLVFIINVMRLAGSSGNPQARSNAMVALLFSGVSAALLGAVTLIVGIFYKAID